MKLRRTMMYVTGSHPGMLRDAYIYGADAIMFDLEDSVSLNEKDAARFLVYQALKSLDYQGVETVVRINGLDTPYGQEDLEAIVRAQPNLIRLPKTETAEDVRLADKAITKIETDTGIQAGSIGLMAAIESALGVINAYEIAISSPRLVAVALGAEDFVTDLRTNRSPDGLELLAARGQIIIAARAAGIAALDTVFSDINDMEGFAREVALIKQLGFDGKSVIHPRQIDVVHSIFTPTDKEIAHAQRVIEAGREAEAKKSGVIALDGKMIDTPLVERANHVLRLAQASGVLQTARVVN